MGREKERYRYRERGRENEGEGEKENIVQDKRLNRRGNMKKWRERKRAFLICFF